MRRRFILDSACRMALFVAGGLAAQGAAHAGPTSPLYLSTGTQIIVIQGDDVLRSWSTGEQEYSIAVDATVRTWSQGNPALSLFGREYHLDGTPTGAVFANEVGCCFRDGTTDGQFNYAVRAGGAPNLVFRFAPDWTDPRPLSLFPPGTASGLSGIAYDPSDDSFWLATAPANTGFVAVLHVNRAGELLSFLGGITGTMVSLAYDRADDTLWLYSWSPAMSQLMQFSTPAGTTTPTFLSGQAGIGFVTGMEFALQTLPAVPEPAAAVLLGAGLAVLRSMAAWRRRRIGGC